MPEENVITRVMPHSEEAEMSVIGAMLMDQQAISKAMELLTPEDFYSRQYGIIFETICELEQSGMAVDPVTLQEKLKEKNLPPEVYDTERLGELLAIVPTAANIASYAKIVADKSAMRKLIRVNEELANAAYAGQVGSDELMAKAETDIFHLSQKRSSSEYVSIKQIVLNAIEKVVMASRISGNVTGYRPALRFG